MAATAKHDYAAVSAVGRGIAECIQCSGRVRHCYGEATDVRKIISKYKSNYLMLVRAGGSNVPDTHPVPGHCGLQLRHHKRSRPHSVQVQSPGRYSVLLCAWTLSQGTGLFIKRLSSMSPPRSPSYLIASYLAAALFFVPCSLIRTRGSFSSRWSYSLSFKYPSCDSADQCFEGAQRGAQTLPTHCCIRRCHFLAWCKDLKNPFNCQNKELVIEEAWLSWQRTKKLIFSAV